MEYTEDDLKMLQLTELAILKDIIRVCEENDISYFTVGGTTLGAIRHNGFIPWDDDIDIGMMRDDYEKFLQIAPSKLSKGLTLSHFMYEAASPTYYAKVRKDGTEFVERYTKNLDMHHGVFVDIMPYDKIPENEVDREKYCKRVKLWNQLYIAKTVWISTFVPSKFKLLRSFVRAILHILMIPIPKSYLFRKTDEAMRAANDTDSKMVSSRALAAFNCNIRDLIPTKKQRFEDIMIAIPGEADKVLKTQYGDYWRLPPKEKRYSHAPVLLKL